MTVRPPRRRASSAAVMRSVALRVVLWAAAVCAMFLSCFVFRLNSFTRSFSAYNALNQLRLIRLLHSTVVYPGVTCKSVSPPIRTMHW